ncbi:TonB-dependent receptor [Luteimonas sp. A537]
MPPDEVPLRPAYVIGMPGPSTSKPGVIMSGTKKALAIAVAAVLASQIAAPADAREAVAGHGADTPEIAEAQGVDPSTGSATTLDAVVVSARKRKESIFEVPVVANVLTQETLERTKVDDLYSIATRVPSLLLGSGVTSSGVQASLRGIGTTAINPTMDNSVSLNIDGLSLSQGAAYGLGMFDVAQIEVLKGPQSLFFGKNNTAGVISLRSADPTDEVEVIGRIGYEAEAEEKVGELIISGPLSDSLKLRLAGRFSDQEGYFRNEAVAVPGLGGRTPDFKDYAPARETLLRGTALYEPSDRFNARLKLNYSDYRVNGAASGFQSVHCPEGTGGVPPIGISFLEGEDCKADRVIRRPWFDLTAFPDAGENGGIPFEDSTQLFGTLEMNFAIGDDLTLTSVTGHYANDFRSLFAGSTSSVGQLMAQTYQFDNKQFSQELRLFSDYADRPVNFMLGAFYQKGEIRNETDIGGNILFGLPRTMQHVLNIVEIEATSVFGQAIWDVNDKLEIAAGARWTDETRWHSLYNFDAGVGPIGWSDRLDPKISASNVSPEASVAYKANEDLTLFASYRTGFKSGSFMGINFTAPDRPASFGEEEAKGGEVGVKFRAFDRKLSANLAAYDYKYTDLQVGALELSDVGNGSYLVFTRTLNAASANVRGVEFDMTYMPDSVSGLMINAALNYNHARYDSFTNAPCGNGQTIAQGCDQLFNPGTGRYSAQDLSGRRLVRAPDWSGFLSFDHEIYLSDGKRINYGAGLNYVSEYATTLVDPPGFPQDSFVKYDAQVALSGVDNKWEIALIGRNLGDENVVGRCSNDNSQNGGILGGQVSGAEQGGPAGQDEGSCFVERGREVWARFSWRF